MKTWKILTFLMLFFVVVLILLLGSMVNADYLAVNICQNGCKALVVANYGLTGFTFGTTNFKTGLMALITSNITFGLCLLARDNLAGCPV